MREILREFKDETKVTGSMVITPDGIVVATVLDRELDEDAIAAFASSLLTAIKRGISKLKADGGLTSCSVSGTEGTITFFDMKNSYLVVVGDADTKLDARSPAVQSTIHKIMNRRVA